MATSAHCGALPFYGPEQAAIHHADFGGLAAAAAHRLLAELHSAGRTNGTVVDLACGSGILAGIVAEAGYDVLGVDISPAMVELARRNAPTATIVSGSLHDVEIPPAVAVAAVGEALNYAVDERAGVDGVTAVVQRVARSLDPHGVFVGDVAMPGRHGAKVRTVIHDRADWTLHMVAEESDDGTRLDRRIAIFSRTGDHTYRRTDEHHVLRLYRPDDLAQAFTPDFSVIFDARYTDAVTAPAPPSGWTVFVARPQPVEV